MLVVFVSVSSEGSLQTVYACGKTECQRHCGRKILLDRDGNPIRTLAQAKPLLYEHGRHMYFHTTSPKPAPCGGASNDPSDYQVCVVVAPRNTEISALFAAADEMDKAQSSPIPQAA